LDEDTEAETPTGPQRRWVGCPDEDSERRRLVGVPADIPDRLLRPPRPPRPTGLLIFTAGGLHAGLRGEAQDGSVGLGGFCCLDGFDGGDRPCEVGRILTPGTAVHLPCVSGGWLSTTTSWSKGMMWSISEVSARRVQRGVVHDCHFPIRRARTSAGMQ